MNYTAEFNNNRFSRSCQKILTQMKNARLAVYRQFRDVIADHEQALRLALNEAEALAWQTPFPQLVFQDLAEEKARAVQAWSIHQREVQAQTSGVRS